jgi:phage tail sheath protein FI
MPITPTYPGIYIQEAPSTTHTIVAAPTNIAVFIGYTHPLKTSPDIYGKAVQIFGFMDYQRQFGGFVRSAAYATSAGLGAGKVYGTTDGNVAGATAEAVNQFFLNGGTTAYIVSTNGTDPNTPNAFLPTAGATMQIGGLTFTAQEVTDEFYSMTVRIVPVKPTTGSPPESALADIIVTFAPSGPSPAGGGPVPGTVTESYRRVSLTPTESDGVTPDPNFIETRIGNSSNPNPVSQLITVDVAASPPLSEFTAASQAFGLTFEADGTTPFSANSAFFTPTDYTAVLQEDTDLDKVPVLNLMVLPGVFEPTVLGTAIAFCERKLAFLIMDPPVNSSTDDTTPPYQTIQSVANGTSLQRSKNAALYFPYLQSPDPFTGSATNPVTGLTSEIPPAPTVAGIFAATDVSRGVWKAPAGFQALTTNTTGVVSRGRMTDPRQGVLNPISVNCLRDFPNTGTIVFGSRTLASTYDQQWTYVPVRRMALFLEQTLLANLKWVIFEPNAQPLWTAITMSIQAFMLGLFKQGAFQGNTPSDAFLVQCNSQTTTQADIDSGIVNIVVGFAPLSPAEFVVITIAQLAGQTQTS